MSDAVRTLSSLADLGEIVGFFSYAREDDDDSKGSLSALRDAIQRELRAVLGRSRRELRLWQDKEAIAAGRLWESEIRVAIEQAVFFIPIITPMVVRSRYCRTEFESFLGREKQLGRSDLVFPILYIRVPELDDELRWRGDPVLSVIGTRQYVDWRVLRLQSVDDIAVKRAIEQLCDKIVETLRLPMTDVAALTALSPKAATAPPEAVQERERQRAEALREAEEAQQQEAERREAERREQAALPPRDDIRDKDVGGDNEKRKRRDSPARPASWRTGAIAGSALAAAALVVVLTLALTGVFNRPVPPPPPSSPNQPQSSSPPLSLEQAAPQPQAAPQSQTVAHAAAPPAAADNMIVGTWKEYWPGLTYNSEYQVTRALGNLAIKNLTWSSDTIADVAFNGPNLTFTMTSAFAIKYSLTMGADGKSLVGTAKTPSEVVDITWKREP